MITISKDPVTGLKRKVKYDFYWLASVRQIIIRCVVSSYNEDDEHVSNARISDYTRELVASDSLVDPANGHIYTPEELAASPVPPTMAEYDFYVYVLGQTPVVLSALIEQIIVARDLEGKFDI